MSPLNTDTTTSPLNEDVIYHILHQLRGSSSDLARAARVHSTWTNSARTHLYREVALPPSHIKDGDKSLVQLQRTLEGLGPMRSIKPLVGNSSLEGLKARVLSTARARYWQGFTSSLSRSSSPTRTGVSYKVDETLVNRIKAVRHSTERGLVALPRFEDLLRMCKSVTEVIVESCTNVSLRSYISSLTTIAPHITTLTLTPHNPQDPTSITSLSSLTASYIASRLHLLTSLRQLTLVRFTASVDNLWPSTPTPLFPRLTNLTLINCRLHRHDLFALLYPSLTTLHLRFQYRSKSNPDVRSITRSQLVDDLLQPLHARLRNLTIVDLPWNDLDELPYPLEEDEVRWFSLEGFEVLETFMFVTNEWRGFKDGGGGMAMSRLRNVEVSALKVGEEGMEDLKRLVKQGTKVWFAKGEKAPLERVEAA